jgi:hypothetical protein
LAGSSAVRGQAQGLFMTAPNQPRRWREFERRHVPGNSPNDRILREPDCNRPKRVCADSFPATPWPKFPRTRKIPGMRFLRQAESIWSDVVSKSKPSKPGAGYRLPLVGPRAQSKDATGGTTRPAHRPQMSSDRLFLDGLLASIARLRFTGTHRLPCTLSPLWQNRTFLLCRE